MKKQIQEGEITIIILIVALIFLFRGLKGLLEGLNILKDPQEKKAQETVIKTIETGNVAPTIPTPAGFIPFDIPGDAFNIQYWRNLQKAAGAEAAKRGLKSGVFLLNSNAQQIRAKNIWESVGFLYDKTGEAVAQFKKCKYKSQVSMICMEFNNKYNQDCLSWMRNKFDRQDQIQDLAEIVNYVNGLPSGAYLFPKNRSIDEIAIK